MSPDAKLEALLFAEAEPVTIKKIATWLNLSETEVEAQTEVKNLLEMLVSKIKVQ